MLHRMSGPVYRGMRKYAKLSQRKLAGKMGVKRQSISRLETGDRELLLRRSEEDLLVQATQVTTPLFVDIASEALTDLGGNPVIVMPSGHYVPSVVLRRAMKMSERYHYTLKPEEAQHIKQLLAEARIAHVDSERLCDLLAETVIRLINAARQAQGENIPSDDEA